MTPQRLEVQKHHNVMFCWLVPRHEAGVAATTWKEKYGCCDSALEMTPQRLWWSEPKSQNTEGTERSIVAGGFDGTPPVSSRPGVRRAPATASIRESTTIPLCPDASRRTRSELHHDALNQQAPQLWCVCRSYGLNNEPKVPELAAVAAVC